MASTLDVVNECLATMGEAPLNVLAEPHEYKTSALRALSKADRATQSRGWWYNREELTLYPDPVNKHITLPGDCLRAIAGARLQRTLISTASKPWLVQRGRRLYDTGTGSFEVSESLTCVIIRQVVFEDLPVVINDLIAAEAVLKFQSSYDGDNNRRRELEQDLARATAYANAENTRQLQVNLLNNNARLNRVKASVRALRG